MSAPRALVVASLAEPATLVRVLELLLVQGGRPEHIELRPMGTSYALRIEASGLAAERAQGLSWRLAGLVGVAGVGCGSIGEALATKS